jgi:hypothetical protein
MQTQLPHWVSWVQALAPTTVAVIALIVTAWIQIGLKTVAKNKLQLDLFKERYELLRIVTRMMKLLNKSSDDFLFEMSKEYDNFRQYGLLFPKAIADKVDQLAKYCYNYQSLKEEAKDMRGSPEFKAANERFRESQAYVEKLFLELKKEIEAFIRVEWRG